MEMINTEHWFVDNNVHNLKDCPQLMAAAAKLRENDVVAFPTETVYGLGGNALSNEAIAKIFAAKGRPADNPLIVHIASSAQVKDLTENIPSQAQKLMDTFWPGPLTLVLEKKSGIAERVTGKLSTVAVRMPNHSIALALIETAGVPIAAPSANLSGKPSPTTATHVSQDLTGKIAGIVDGGATGVGVESTVVDCSDGNVTILRPGGITKEQLTQVVGTVYVDPSLHTTERTPKSPGMKYQHYAPNAKLYLVDGSFAFLQEIVDQRRTQGMKVGVLTTEERKKAYCADEVAAFGTREDPASIARGLYGALRTFDATDVQEIFCETFSEEGVGAAIMNRLVKAAGGRIITEK